MKSNPNPLTLNDYQLLATETADYPDIGTNTIYPALKLAGEAGEVADKIGKLWRNHGWIQGSEYTTEVKFEIIKELGDVLWYIAALGNELGVDLEFIGQENLKKLKDRKERGVIKGEGDNR